jgi:hypothetical protein
MKTQSDSRAGRPGQGHRETEVDFTGYDPYIVAITGGAREEGRPTADSEDLAESRKAKLMAWLRDNRKQL